MSMMDKVVAAVTPLESEEARGTARAKARSAARPGDWLTMVLDHHWQIEAAFARVKSANEGAARTKAFKELALILTGHSIAEEASLYPALAEAHERGHATTAYTEQATAKLEMGLLADLPPMSQEFLDKLEHIRAAVAHHVYEEEGTWFLELRAKLPAATQAKLRERYEEQFSRYRGSEAKAAV
jgi:Hemerythrin HHE cation binding domain